MIVWRIEYKIDSSKWFEAVAMSKAWFEEGGVWHNKTKGYRIYDGSESGDIGRLVLELNFESLAEYEAMWAEVLAQVGSAPPEEEPDRYRELFGDKMHRSFWRLASEG